MKALIMRLSMNGLPVLVFPTRPAPDHLPGNLHRYATGVSVPIIGCEVPCLAISTAISFLSIPVCPGTHTSSASFSIW